jgi:hypothetical protein
MNEGAIEVSSPVTQSKQAGRWISAGRQQADGGEEEVASCAGNRALKVWKIFIEMISEVSEQGGQELPWKQAEAEDSYNTASWIKGCRAG